MVHANNSITNVSEMADEEQCNLTSLVVAELRNLGVKVPKLKKSRTSAKQASRRSGGQGGTFGMPLEKQQLAVSGETGIPIPIAHLPLCFARFLKITTEYLLLSKSSDGLFRKAGSISRQRELRRNIESGQSLQGAQVHDVAGILKQWFRELPETVVPEYMNELIMRCTQLSSEPLQVNAFQLACLLLPVEHLHVLQHTLLFLSTVARESGANRMDAHNLAVVMAPNLLTSRCEMMPPKKASYLLQSQTLFVELMICHAQQVGHMPPLVKNSLPINPSDEELEHSGDELGQRQRVKTRKQGILANKLRCIVPRARGTRLRVVEAATLDLVDMECSPRLPSTVSSRLELKRKAFAMSTGQREMESENLNLGPRKKARSPLTVSTEKMSVCDMVAIARRQTHSKHSVTSLASIDPLTASDDNKDRRAPVRRYSTPSLKNTLSVPITENSNGARTQMTRGAKHSCRSLTFFAGCYAAHRIEATTPEHRVPTPGTVKSRSTLKRGRPNTIQSGLPSPFRSNSDILTPQASRKTPRCIKFDAPTVNGLPSGSTFSLNDMDSVESHLFGGGGMSIDNHAAGTKCDKLVQTPLCCTSIENWNLSRQSSYVSIYDGLRNNVQTVPHYSEEVCGGRAETSPHRTSVDRLHEIKAEDVISLTRDAGCDKLDSDRQPETKATGPYLSSAESSLSVSRIVDSTPTPPRASEPVEQEKKGTPLNDLFELIKSETWATPLPTAARDDDDDFSRRESIVQIRKKNAGLVRHNVRLFSQGCANSVRKVASVRVGPTFVRNAAETRSLRSNSSSTSLQRSPLQETNRMGISRKASLKSEKRVGRALEDGPKEWVMEV
ncbi:uncharacterized protein LOC135401763 isoform X2 [Ornithodoros turicata]|uniref:uncharacterized protein LOC135401763 isoform X2 n=1 Tax=Ornithodoros turicata TaxID=34597 RepID=UPI003139BB7D